MDVRSLSPVFDGPVRGREGIVKGLLAIGSALVAVAAALDVPARVELPAIRPQMTAESTPRTLDECFAVLAKKLPAETLVEMQRGSEDDMSRYHHGLGTWLRNNWGLWDRGPLYQHFHALGLNHPDDMSGVILDSFWRYLHERPLEVEKQVAAYREYERAAKYPSPNSNPRCASAIEVVLTLYRDWPNGSPRIIHMGECCADHVVWSYEVDRGWYRPDAAQSAAWGSDPEERYDPCGKRAAVEQGDEADER